MLLLPMMMTNMQTRGEVRRMGMFKLKYKKMKAYFFQEVLMKDRAPRHTTNES